MYACSNQIISEVTSSYEFCYSMNIYVKNIIIQE